jgi:hypothetical protein
MFIGRLTPMQRAYMEQLRTAIPTEAGGYRSTPYSGAQQPFARAVIDPRINALAEARSTPESAPLGYTTGRPTFDLLRNLGQQGQNSASMTGMVTGAPVEDYFGTMAGQNVNFQNAMLNALVRAAQSNKS